MRWWPYELHPEYPREGAPVPRRSGGGLRALLDEAGLPVVARETSSNSGRALAVSAALAGQPAWAALHRRMFEVYWVEGADLHDTSVLASVTAETVGAVDVDEVTERGAPLVLEARERAHDLGLAATPGWHFGDGVVFPGAHDRAVFDRIIGRLRG